jgi:hypothetical protein
MLNRWRKLNPHKRYRLLEQRNFSIAITAVVVNPIPKMEKPKLKLVIETPSGSGQRHNPSGSDRSATIDRRAVTDDAQTQNPKPMTKHSKLRKKNEKLVQQLDELALRFQNLQGEARDLDEMHNVLQAAHYDLQQTHSKSLEELKIWQNFAEVVPEHISAIFQNQKNQLSTPGQREEKSPTYPLY